MPMTKEKRKAKRQLNRVNGLCSCGNQPSKNRKTCERCYSRQKGVKDRKHLLGFCVRCNKKKERPNKRLCNSCITKSTQINKKRKLNGLCSCGKKTTGGKKTCDSCLKKRKIKIYSHKKNGLCWCGNVLEKGYKTCYRCRVRDNKYQRKNVENGLCRCGNKRTYWWKTTCTTCLKRTKQWHIALNKRCKKLYRPATKEEIKKYGGKGRIAILNMVLRYLGEDII